jgi:hypothetical protein
VGGPNPERRPPLLTDRRKLRDWAADHPAWAIQVSCRRCVHVTTLHPAKIRHPHIRRIGDLKARLVCSKCGSWDYSLKSQLLLRRD